MSQAERDAYLVDGFVRRTLNSEEQQEFAERQGDALFQEKVQKHQDLISVLKREEREKSKAVIKSFEQQNGKHAMVSKVWYFAAAASLAILLMVVLWPMRSNSDELFAEYYTHFPDAISDATRAEPAIGPKDLLMRPYNEKNWTMATAKFEGYLSKQPDDLEIKFYYGLSLLMHDQADEAADILVDIEENILDPDYQSAAEWYAALSYLKSGDLEQCTEKLKLIAGSNHYKRDPAADLLEKLTHHK